MYNIKASIPAWMEHGGFISRKYVTKIIISYTDLDVEKNAG